MRASLRSGMDAGWLVMDHKLHSNSNHWYWMEFYHTQSASCTDMYQGLHTPLAYAVIKYDGFNLQLLQSIPFNWQCFSMEPIQAMWAQLSVSIYSGCPLLFSILLFVRYISLAAAGQKRKVWTPNTSGLFSYIWVGQRTHVKLIFQLTIPSKWLNSQIRISLKCFCGYVAYLQ